MEDFKKLVKETIQTRIIETDRIVDYQFWLSDDNVYKMAAVIVISEGHNIFKYLCSQRDNDELQIKCKMLLD